MLVKNFSKIDLEEEIDHMSFGYAGGALVVATMNKLLGVSVSFKIKPEINIDDSISNKEFEIAIKKQLSAISSKDKNTFVAIYDNAQKRQCYISIKSDFCSDDFALYDFSEFDIVFFCSVSASIVKTLFKENLSIKETCSVLIPNGLIGTYFNNSNFSVPANFLFVNQAEFDSVLCENVGVSAEKNKMQDISKGITNIVITKGKDGVSAFVDGNYLQQNVLNVDTPIHPGGAGDSFAVGFMSSYMSIPKELDTAILKGHECAIKALKTVDILEVL